MNSQVKPTHDAREPRCEYLAGPIDLLTEAASSRPSDSYFSECFWYRRRSIDDLVALLAGSVEHRGICSSAGFLGRTIIINQALLEVGVRTLNSSSHFGLPWIVESKDCQEGGI